MTFRNRALVPVFVLLVATGWAGVGPSAQGWRDAGVAAFETVWRTVNDTYYDPDFGGLDWAAVHTELRPAVERAASAEEQRAVIRGMLARLGQSHFALLPASPDAVDLRGPASVPFDVRMTSEGLIVTRLHPGAFADADEASTLRPGDRIRQIDGVAVDALLDGIAQRDPRRDALAWRRAMQVLSGDAGTSVLVTVQRQREDAGVPAEAEEKEEADEAGPATQSVSVRRIPEPGDIVKVGNLPAMRAHLETESHLTPNGRRVGLIRFSVWMTAIAEPFAEAIDGFRQHDAVIIDLRGNPGGLADMIRGIAGHVLDEPAVLGRMRMRDLDLEFRANPRRSTSAGQSVTPYGGPVGLLVDELTASASECFAGALQSLQRARVFGTRTSGQALPASTQQLANGDVLLYAVGDFVTTTGQRLEGVGVVPDVEIPLTPEALAEGQDALRAALEWVDAYYDERPGER